MWKCHRQAKGLALSWGQATMRDGLECSVTIDMELPDRHLDYGGCVAQIAMARINELNILRLLLEAPMTCEWLLRASAAFPRPYRSVDRVRRVMASLGERGLVRRSPMREVHRGQQRWLYYLAGFRNSGWSEIAREARSAVWKLGSREGSRRCPGPSLPIAMLRRRSPGAR